MSDTIPVLLKGGPYTETDGEVIAPPPPTLAFLGGAYVYRLDDRSHQRGREVYRYAPDLSTGHAALVNADREAVLEVAQREGMTVGEVLERAKARRRAANGGEHPAKVLLDEAARLGVSVESLLAERQERGLIVEGLS